jgi:DNA-binding LacI/PurR family transcriptional regulator
MQRFETITKASQALNHLRRRILTRDFSGGQKIPPERILAREYALSRATINKITSFLVQEGLLERRGPHGTFVVGRDGGPATAQIGFLMQTMTPQEVNPIYEAVFRSFVRASHSEPVRTVFGMMGSWGATLPRGFHVGGLDALVLAGRFAVDRIMPFVARKVPILWVDQVEDADPLNLVTTDHVEAGRLAAERLLAQGRRAIVVLSYPIGCYNGFELRLEGFRKAHASAGVSIDERRILRPYYSKPEHVVELLRKLSADGVAYDAVFGMSDSLAIWGMDALARLGSKVPEEVSVIGVDGLPAGEWTRPRLTTVAQPAEVIGERAFARILGMVTGTGVAQGAERIAPRLIVRESA